MTTKAAIPPPAVKFGFCSMYPAPGIIERVGPDWDWVWIDGQHGQLCGYQEILAMVRACNLAGTKAFVRVPSHESSWIGLALDMNADGVIVPQVDTPDQARAIVRAAKYPPLGNRSYGGRRPIDLLGRGYYKTANQDQKLICQVESLEALANAADLAAVEGVDGLFLGPDDMLLRQGHPMDQPHDTAKLIASLEQVAAACRQHGKIACMVARDPAMISVCVRLGVGMIVSGGDVPLLADGSKKASAAARQAAVEATAAVQSKNPTAAGGSKSLY